MRGRFSVDRRSPSMLLFGTLSLFRTKFAGCYTLISMHCDVTLASFVWMILMHVCSEENVYAFWSELHPYSDQSNLTKLCNVF